MKDWMKKCSQVSTWQCKSNSFIKEGPRLNDIGFIQQCVEMILKLYGFTVNICLNVTIAWSFLHSPAITWPIPTLNENGFSLPVLVLQHTTLNVRPQQCMDNKWDNLFNQCHNL